jgi:hypothetical protein
MEMERGEEILYYLESNEVESYVVLDDRNFDFINNNLNFVKCESNLGLTKELSEKCIEFLNL